MLRNSLDDVIRFMRELAFDADGIMLEYYKKAKASSKPGGDETKTIVTDADHNVQDYVLGRIIGRYPDSSVYAEEDRDVKDKFQPDSNYRWVLDPIDGTLNYSQGKHEFGLSFGLMKDERFVAGIITLPAYGIMRSDYERDGSLLDFSCLKSDRDDVIISSEINNNNGDMAKKLHKEGLSITKSSRCSVYNIHSLLEGRAGSFILYNAPIWDVGPGAYLVEKKGGHVCDFDGGPVNYKETIPSIIMSSSKYSARLIISALENINHKNYWSEKK